ncbi:hypothetical protein EON65_39050 [archaeon]|nr:MAG: hypothetical protein EON65_39050 [archaeon]
MHGHSESDDDDAAQVFRILPQEEMFEAVLTCASPMGNMHNMQHHLNMSNGMNGTMNANMLANLYTMPAMTNMSNMNLYHMGGHMTHNNMQPMSTIISNNMLNNMPNNSNNMSTNMPTNMTTGTMSSNMNNMPNNMPNNTNNMPSTANNMPAGVPLTNMHMMM